MSHDIYLKLEGEIIKWSEDGSTNWKKVTANSPSTGVDKNDQVNWIAKDDSGISKVKIMPSRGGVILNPVSNNDTRNPHASTKSSIPNPSTEKYDLWVLPNPPSGGYIKVDPEVQYPPN